MTTKRPYMIPTDTLHIGEATMSTTTETAIKPASSAITPHIGPQQGMQQRPWDLGDGATMTAIIPVKLTKKNIDRLKKYVNALEVEASIAWEDDGGE